MNSNKYIVSFGIGSMLLFTGCQMDGPEQLYDGEKLGKPVFGVSLEEAVRVNTRGGRKVSENGLDSVYVSHTPWNQDFYIQLNTTDAAGDPETEYGVYVVPSAYEGRLDSKNPEKALDWMNLDRNHTFYSWTVPWMETEPSYVFPDDNNKQDGVEYYTPSDDELHVSFENSAGLDGYEQNHNNAIYEGFIGAKSTAHNYLEHGKYVDLTFFHLVSKIRVDGLMLIESDGSVQESLQADMTFVGMPVGATFYPHPENGGVSGAPENSRPYVGKPWDASPDEGVTYYIANKAGQEDVFYICPEVDFSQIDYQIRITSDNYEHKDIYYGSFNDVEFVRKSGWAHDKGDDETGSIIDQKILHAGEEMRINIVLIPGVGPGLKIIIQNWSTDKPLDSKYHTHPGFYDEAELNQLLDYLYGFTAEDFDHPSEELELLFEMYGYTKDGKKYFPLYENFSPQKGNRPSNIFPIPPGYIIDGMGHTVTLQTNSGNYFGTGRNETYFNVGGQCRDIYFTDTNGNNTIYIDSDGYVWITNKTTGELEQTENQMPDPASKKGFDISADSGKIRETDYYNDNITG